MTSDFEGFLYQILSITLFSYLNSWERASIYPFQCWVLNKGTTGTILITSLVWLGPWLGIEPGTSHTRCQHSTTRLSRRRLFYDYIIFNRPLHYKNLHSIIYNIYYFFTQFSTWHTYMFVFRQVDVHMFQCTNTQKRRNKTHYNLRYFIFSFFFRVYFIITIKCN